MKSRVLIAALAISGASHAAAGVLQVDRADGAQLLRGAERLAVEPDTALEELDRLQVGARGRVTLALSRHGFIEAGPRAQVQLVKLPFASFAEDLRTELRLDAGFMRVVWKHPALASNWPLVVSLGPWRADLMSGEYLFETDAQGTSLCVAGGRAVLSGNGARSATTLAGPACYRLAPGKPPTQARRLTQEDFAEPRQRLAIGDIAGSTAPQEADTDPLALREPVTPASSARASVPARVVSSAALATAPMVAPAPAPARATARSAHPGGERWTLNVASYLARRDAEAHLARLREAGQSPTLEEAQVKGKTWYRVQIRDLSDREAALRLKAQVGEPDSWSVRQP